MTISLVFEGPAALLIFDRADQMNALNGAMVEEILLAIEQVARDPAVRALVVTGAGGHFMAGADIKDYARQSAQDFRAFQISAARVYAALEALPKPVIAAIEGYALGGGFEIALACDMIIAHPGAQLGLPEVKLGLVPGGGGTQRLARKLGPNIAAELLMTGRFADAAEMERRGVINRIAADPRMAALELAADIARHPTNAVADVKRLNLVAWSDGLESGLLAEGEALGQLFETGDGMDRIRAFVERSERKKQEKRGGHS
ncbi:MAG: enoyl-CoA hydratase/isomerase family protein [Methylobacterium sp.]|nr:enoyl-CoA hydratase/isomerase family protein [Methylobacterium sp.]MCA3603203.1 enoyl-CoA hydratase/isomerase family protein [Methylobacterium sp.]MCA3615551.1 enoyl-CoA hydratase/isomerase family protein [Methylobacterium sp.]MCA3640819.1 enoyl-CoA hydratase/isomerase family protein [Methylobacterium sp.]MCA4911154.1 enoyl-CoA hydratase/isomerase family protein [Methylobacterium sp.]